MDKNFEFMQCGSLQDRLNQFKEQTAKSENKSMTNPYSSSYKKPDLRKGMDRYGRPPKGSLTEARGIKAGKYMCDEVMFLCELIEKFGETDTKTGITKITFGRMFKVYQGYSDSKIYKDILELCEMIDQCGIERPDGCKVIRFGNLFRLYTRISDTVVGMLLRARKYGLVSFEGEMLYQRQDDNKIITMTMPYHEIKARLRPSGDPKDCIKLIDPDNPNADDGKPSEVDEPGEFIEVHGIYKWVRSAPARDPLAENVEDRQRAEKLAKEKENQDKAKAQKAEIPEKTDNYEKNEDNSEKTTNDNHNQVDEKVGERKKDLGKNDNSVTSQNDAELNKSTRVKPVISPGEKIKSPLKKKKVIKKKKDIKVDKETSDATSNSPQTGIKGNGSDMTSNKSDTTEIQAEKLKKPSDSKTSQNMQADSEIEKPSENEKITQPQRSEDVKNDENTEESTENKNEDEYTKNEISETPESLDSDAELPPILVASDNEMTTEEGITPGSATSGDSGFVDD